MTKSNVNVICGMNGSRTNNCTIQNGEIGVLYTPGYFFNDHISFDNILLKGITFRNLTCDDNAHELCQTTDGAAITLVTHVNITIEDCLFDNNRAQVIYYDPYRLGYPKERILNNTISNISYEGTLKINNSTFRVSF